MKALVFACAWASWACAWGVCEESWGRSGSCEESSLLQRHGEPVAPSLLSAAPETRKAEAKAKEAAEAEAKAAAKAEAKALKEQEEEDLRREEMNLPPSTDDPNANFPWEDSCVIFLCACAAVLVYGLGLGSALWAALEVQVLQEQNQMQNLLGKMLQVAICFGIHIGLSKLQHNTTAICMLCILANFLGLLQALRPVKTSTKWWRMPEIVGALTMLSLEFLMLLSLGNSKGQVQREAFLGLIGAIPATLGSAMLLRSERSDCWAFWGSFTGHVVLPMTASGALSQKLSYFSSQCLEDEDFFSIRYSPAAAYASCFFILMLWACYQMAPDLMWRGAFAGVLLMVLTPGLSHTTGYDILYGPWAMFGGSHEGWDPTRLGLVAIVLGALAVLALLVAAPWGGVVTFDWGQGVRPSLALARILLAFWCMEHVYWGGDDSPFIKWWSPQLLPGGDTFGSRIMMRCLLILVALGFHSQFFAAVSAAGFCVACSRRSFDPDCPTQHVGIMLLILSFTPCDACYSLSSWLRRGAAAPAARGDGLWATGLFRLHASLLYFFAAEFKLQPDWLSGNGGALYKDIHIWKLSPLSSVYTFFVHSKQLQMFTAYWMARGIIALEISLAFGFWSQRWQGHFLLLAALMHLAMVLLCGQLGGFSQAGWTGLLAVSHAKLEDFLENPKQFWGLAVSLALVYSFFGQVFESHPTPA